MLYASHPEINDSELAEASNSYIFSFECILNADDRMILECVSGKYGWWASLEFIWLRTGAVVNTVMNLAVPQ
jgi:hypothetical protein